MKTFIEHIIEEVSRRSVQQLHERIFVFPTRRACRQFLYVLRKTFKDEPFWLPEAISISEFFERASGKKVTDELELLFELYEVYRPFEIELSFHRFYSWGKLLLKDFDEMDKHLVDAEKLFDTLTDLDEIDRNFQTDAEVAKAIKLFRNVVRKGAETKIVHTYSQLWKIVARTYSSFKDHLRSKGLSYEGLLYRMVAENPAENSFPGHHSFAFCGFSALTLAEEKILHHLLEKDRVLCFWDADEQHFKDSKFEAGHFIRKYFFEKDWKRPPHFWITTDLANSEAEIKIFETGTNLGQCIAAGNNCPQPSSTSSPNSAIVLGDEGILSMLLPELPYAHSINTTMGLPLAENLYAQFIGELLNFRLHLKKEFFHWETFNEQLLQLLWHPIISTILPPENRLRLARTSINTTPILTKKRYEKTVNEMRLGPLFHASLNTLQFIEFLLSSEDGNVQAENEEAPPSLQQIGREESIELLKIIRDQLLKFKWLNNFESLNKLWQHLILQRKIPLTGDPLQGLQLMGFLESRNLDFEELIILSANEGILPQNQSGNTFIPFSLRKAFGLPTPGDQNAIYAYHFFRLLARAKKINIFYNAESGLNRNPEPSRFVFLLLQWAEEPKKSIKVTQRRYSAHGTSEEKTPLISLRKESLVEERLKSFQNINSESIEKSFSASALSAYRRCPSFFFWKYLAAIPEPSPRLRGFDPLQFGNLLHNTLFLHYQPWEGRKISAVDFQSLIQDANIQSSLTKALETTNKETIDQLSGARQLDLKILQELLKKLIRTDADQPPEQFLELEKRHEKVLRLSNGRLVRLQGIIDRIDLVERDGKLTRRVIDYKSGDLSRTIHLEKRLQQMDDEQKIELIFKSEELTPVFQLYFYVYLYSSKTKYSISAALYGFRKNTHGFHHINQGQPLTTNLIQIFEKHLIQLIEEIFDLNKTFELKENEPCSFCSYKELCPAE